MDGGRGKQRGRSHYTLLLLSRHTPHVPRLTPSASTRVSVKQAKALRKAGAVTGMAAGNDLTMPGRDVTTLSPGCWTLRTAELQHRKVSSASHSDRPRARQTRQATTCHRKSSLHTY
ncbi:hypothetical protein E2C01_077398 [Portunus trituberculatus]|uniref:Uncharacterized protein n=1 Tax=Portunus trituberculatus TaxID=210409 RepID=A0A5B7IK60_PORTR|nr:hypothetical protein [Portunus trituberculatus]